jgi:hypothetical protein
MLVSVRRKAEHLVLLRPFGGQVDETGNAHPVREPTIDGGKQGRAIIARLFPFYGKRCRCHSELLSGSQSPLDSILLAIIHLVSGVTCCFSCGGCFRVRSTEYRGKGCPVCQNRDIRARLVQRRPRFDDSDYYDQRIERCV